ncbi:hypothetical protein ACE1B4_09420 [Aeromonas veronii]|nr:MULTISPECIES: hypothetical protein [Aeromonas]
MTNAERYGVVLKVVMAYFNSRPLASVWDRTEKASAIKALGANKQ